MKQIICLSHSPWSARPNRTQQLLTRMSDSNILFFEPLGAQKNKDAKDGLRVRSNIAVYSLPAIPGGMEQPFFRRRNQRRLSRYIQAVMDKHHFREPVLWCTSPENCFLIDQLAYRALIYDCHKEWDEFPLEWESELTAAADVVCAASPGLVKRLSPCSDNIALLPNGANPAMFLRPDLTAPDCVAQLPRPILARVGDLTADLELAPLIYAAQRRPDWTFLLLGRVGRRAAASLAPLPNVVLAGPVTAVELPDYLSGCQALFDLIHTRRRGSDIIPSRIYEYFATGKPVVTMVEPEQVEPFPDVVYTAFDPNGFLRRCQTALEESGDLARDRRLEYAEAAAWSRRAQEIARILEDTGLC